MTEKNFTVKFSVVMNSKKDEFMSNLKKAYEGYTAECGGGKATITSPQLTGIEGFKEVKAIYEYLVSIGCSLNNECFFTIEHECNELQTAIKAVQMYRKLENVLDVLVSQTANDSRLTNVTSDDLNALLDNPEATYEDLEAVLGDDKCVAVTPEGITFRNNKGSIDYKKNVNWAILSQRFIERAAEAKFVTDNQVEADDVRALRNVLRTIPAKGCDAYTAAAYNYLRQTA